MFTAMEGRAKALGAFPRLRFSRRSGLAFLSGLLPAHRWQRLSGLDTRRPDRRTRWSLKYIAWAWIVMGWSLQRQAVARFEEARATVTRFFSHRRQPGATYQGLVRASTRVGVTALHQFWLSLRHEYGDRLRRAFDWQGWNVLAVDGSRFDTPHTHAHERIPGISGRAKTHPQWNVTLLMHLPTGLLWNWRQGSADESERGQLRAMLDDLPERTLLVADAGFTGFDLLWELHGRGHVFLVRCGSNVRLLVDDPGWRADVQIRSKTVYLWPDREQAQGGLPLCLRLIVVKKRGKSVYLLTNALESTRLSHATARQIYRARWGVEIGYREIKQTLDRRKLLARTPGVSTMELAAGMIAWGLLRLYACIMLGPRLLRLSMASALRWIRRMLEDIRHGEATPAAFHAIRLCLRDDYCRRRPKRLRDWPRKKIEPPPQPPKLRKMKQREINSLHALVAAIPLPR